jgi:hypothetical protein
MVWAGGFASADLRLALAVLLELRRGRRAHDKPPRGSAALGHESPAAHHASQEVTDRPPRLQVDPQFCRTEALRMPLEQVENLST